MKNEKITVIMSTYKEEEKLLREAIESILSQTYKNFEFIIILDYPENEMHKEVITSYAQKDERIKFYINEKNMGLTASLNKGLSLSSGTYIARMDADDVSLPERFAKQYAYLCENGYDLVGGITQMIDEEGNVIYSIKKVPQDFSKIKKALKYGQCIAHPTWFGKKEVFETLQGYRNMPLCEDYDFTLRAVLKGYKISNVNETLLKYRMTANSISRSNLYEQYLFMCVITGCYARGKVASVEKTKKLVAELNDPKKAEKYLKANVIFNRMLKEMEDKKLLLFVKDGFKLLVTSKDYLDKIFRFAMLTLNS